MLIVVAALKGGVGKTTVAVGVAEAAASEHGSALLVDADPQGSAMRWSDTASEEGLGLRAVTVSLPTRDLRRRLSGIGAGYPVVVVDTPPGQLPIISAAVDLADVVIVPSQTSWSDLDRLEGTLDLARDARAPAMVVLNRVRAGTRSWEEATASLEEARVWLAKTALPQREAIAAAYGRRPGAPLLSLTRELVAEIEAGVNSRRKRRR
ncbi:MAG TPA: ParA family protein [Acidimicrobiales bacterium]|nr:ParA family protein [Acidimicrobiales bacterium]